MNIQVSVFADGDVTSTGVRLERLPGEVMRYRARFTNTTSRVLKLDYFAFSGFTFAGKGVDLRVYREGWTAVSPAATRRCGECDLSIFPEYLPFAVCDPKHYTWEKTNIFSAENVAVINNRRNGRDGGC